MHMMMLGPGEIAIIVLIVFFIFGASRLPQLGSGLGKGLRNFKQSISGSDEEDKKIIEKNRRP